MKSYLVGLTRIVLIGMALLPVLTRADIKPETMVGLWLFEEGKGDTVADLSPHGFKGTLTNAKWDEGKFGKAADIAKGGTVTCPLDVGVVRDQITVVAWLKFTDLASQQNYFSIWDSGDKRIVPYKTDGNELRFWTNNWNIGSSFSVSAKTWVHVANICDGKTASIYVNGVQKVSQGAAGFSLDNTKQTAWIATDKGTGFLSAVVVDDVGLFNAALTADDVNKIMTRGLGLATGVEAVHSAEKLVRTWAQVKNNY